LLISDLATAFAVVFVARHLTLAPQPTISEIAFLSTA
jgi:hypothetical protein